MLSVHLGKSAASHGMQPLCNFKTVVGPVPQKTPCLLFFKGSCSALKSAEMYLINCELVQK